MWWEKARYNVLRGNYNHTTQPPGCNVRHPRQLLLAFAHGDDVIYFYSVVEQGNLFQLLNVHTNVGSLVSVNIVSSATTRYLVDRFSTNVCIPYRCRVSQWYQHSFICHFLITFSCCISRKDTLPS
jgi:hypothetical protein